MTTVGLKPPSHGKEMRQSLLADDGLAGPQPASATAARDTIDADAYLNFGFGGDYLDQSEKTDLGLNAAALANREYISLEEFDLDGDGEVDMDQLEELMAKLNKYKKKEQTWRRFLLAGVVAIIFFALILLAIVILGFAITRETAVNQTRALTTTRGKVIATESFYEPLNAQRRNTLMQTDKIVGWFGDQYVNAEISTVLQRTQEVYEFRTYRENFFFRLDTSDPSNVMNMYLYHKDGNISEWNGRLASNLLSTVPVPLTTGDNTTTTPAPTIQRRRLGYANQGGASTTQTGHRGIPESFVEVEQENRERACFRPLLQPWNPSTKSKWTSIGTTNGRVRCPFSVGFELAFMTGGPGNNRMSVLQLAPNGGSRDQLNSMPHIYTTGSGGLCVEIALKGGSDRLLSKCDNWEWIPQIYDPSVKFAIRVDVGCAWTKLWANGQEVATMWHMRNVYHRYVKKMKILRYESRGFWKKKYNKKPFFKIIFARKKDKKKYKKKKKLGKCFKKIGKIFKKPFKFGKKRKWGFRRRLQDENDERLSYDDGLFVRSRPREVEVTEHELEQQRRRRMIFGISEWLKNWKNIPVHDNQVMRLYSPGYLQGSNVILTEIYVVCNHFFYKFEYINEKLTFHDANAYCNREFGTSLVSIHSPDETQRVAELIRKKGGASRPTWIGQFRLPKDLRSFVYLLPWLRYKYKYNTRRAWIWMDATGLIENYNDWNSRRKYTYSSSDCTTQRSTRHRFFFHSWYSHHWYAQRCNEKHSFVCWKEGWHPTGYVFIRMKGFLGKFNQIPNCPRLGNGKYDGRYTFAEAKKKCTVLADCSGIALSAFHTHWNERNEKTWVEFKRWDAHLCRIPRVILYDQWAYYNRSLDSIPPPGPAPTTAAPSTVPTVGPTLFPSLNPSLSPTIGPTVRPTRSPTKSPSLTPTKSPSISPTWSPTMSPTRSPTRAPSQTPSRSPTKGPTRGPTMVPSSVPSAVPSFVPSVSPSSVPTTSPTRAPISSTCADTGNIVFVEKNLTHSDAQIYCQDVYGGRLAMIPDYFTAKNIMEMALEMVGYTPSETNPLTPWTAGEASGGDIVWNYHYDANKALVKIPGQKFATWPATGASIYVGGSAIDLQKNRCLRFANPLDPYSFTLLELDDCGQSNYFFCEYDNYDVFIQTPMRYSEALYHCKTRYCGGIACPILVEDRAQTILENQGYGFETLDSVFTGAYYDVQMGWRCEEWADKAIFLANGTLQQKLLPVTPNFTPQVSANLPNNSNTAVCILPGQYASSTWGYDGSIAAKKMWWKCTEDVKRRFWCSTRGFTSDPTASPTTGVPTVTPTNRPSVTPTAFPSKNPSTTPSRSPSKSPSTTPTKAPSMGPSQSPSLSPSRTPTRSPSLSPSRTPTQTPTKSPSRNPSRSPSSVPSVSPSQAPSMAPSLVPSAGPSSSPSTVPSVSPSQFPTGVPSSAPSLMPSASPSAVPTQGPSSMPSSAPSFAPSGIPSAAPSLAPSVGPSSVPTQYPTGNPSSVPSRAPSIAPTVAPTFPTNAPTSIPTTSPSGAPSSSPSTAPSLAPSSVPTPAPTVQPTDHPTPPTGAPSDSPTRGPTLGPSISPTNFPTQSPITSNPSITPTKAPSKTPSVTPTKNPTMTPSTSPTKNPSTSPTQSPSSGPSLSPSKHPSSSPSLSPSNSPSLSPTKSPSTTPTKSPSTGPSITPTKNPSVTPTLFPSKNPTGSPTKNPTNTPSRLPTGAPSSVPSQVPSFVPTIVPTEAPTVAPLTSSPSAFPSQTPSAKPTTPIPSRSPATPSPSQTPTQVPTRAPFVPIDQVRIYLPMNELTDRRLAFEFKLPGGSIDRTPEASDCAYSNPQTSSLPGGLTFLGPEIQCTDAGRTCNINQDYLGGGITMLCDRITECFQQNADGSCVKGGGAPAPTGAFEFRVLNQNAQNQAAAMGALWELSPETFAVFGACFLVVMMATCYQLMKIYYEGALKSSMLVSLTHCYVLFLAGANCGTMFYFTYKAYPFMEVRLNIAFAGLTAWAVVSTAGAIALNWLQLYFWNLKGLSNWKAKIAARPYRSAINWTVIFNCIVPMGMVFGAIWDARTVNSYQAIIEKTLYVLVAFESLTIALGFITMGGALTWQVGQRAAENRELYGEDFESPLDRLVFRLAIITFAVALLCIFLGVVSALFAAVPTTQMLLLTTRSAMVCAGVLCLLLWLVLYIPAVQMTIEVAQRKRRSRQVSEVQSRDEESQFGSIRGSVTMELDGSSERGRFGSRREHDESAVESFMNARKAAEEERVQQEKQKKKNKKKKKKRKKNKDEYSSALDYDDIAAADGGQQANEGGFDEFPDPMRKDSTFQNLPQLPASYGERI